METLAGTGSLVRFALRRDRVRLPVWILAITATTVAIASTWDATFTAADLANRQALMSNPAMVAFNGPRYALADYSLPAMITNELLVISVVLTALMSLLLVVRHTRAEEESGRAELVRAAVVGRHAPVAAAVTVAAGAAMVVGAATALGLAGAVAELSLAGSLAFGAAMTGAGWSFTAVAALAAQVSSHTRAASGLAVAALGTAYVVRAAGDIGDNALSWLSPIGWSQAVRPYLDERWWPLLLPVALLVALGVVAVLLSTRRDVAAGLVAPRPGPAGAAPALARSGGLAWRLQRGGLIAWTCALVAFGLAFGAVVSDIERFLADTPQLEEILPVTAGAGLLDGFLAMVTLLMALLATGGALQAALRMSAEEAAGRLEPLLATALPRARWAAGHVLLALAGGAVMLLAGALMLGVSAAASTGDAALVPRLLGAAVAYLPAMWLTVAVVVSLFGVVPRLAAAGWAVLVYAVFVGLFAGALDLPAAARDASPFAHVPRLPGAEVAVLPLLVLVAVAAVLVAVGLVSLRRRGVAVT